MDACELICRPSVPSLAWRATGGSALLRSRRILRLACLPPTPAHLSPEVKAPLRDAVRLVNSHKRQALHRREESACSVGSARACWCRTAAYVGDASRLGGLLLPGSQVLTQTWQADRQLRRLVLTAESRSARRRSIALAASSGVM